MQAKFSRIEKVIGSSNVSLLSEKCVLVLGCGGVGSYVVEALVRSNIGKVILVDYDKVDVSNINRQIMAYDSTVGEYKVDVLERRIKDINSNCSVLKIYDKITANNYSILFENKIDYFVDACDFVEAKKCVMLECSKRCIPFVSSMGTGNKLNPSKLDIVKLDKTFNDPLAKVMRKFAKDNNIKNVMVLSSSELPVKLSDRTPGSLMFVPASAGILIASYVVREIIKKN